MSITLEYYGDEGSKDQPRVMCPACGSYDICLESIRRSDNSRIAYKKYFCFDCDESWLEKTTVEMLMKERGELL